MDIGRSQSTSQLDIWFDEPDRPIGRLDTLSSEQRQQILVEWNSTAQPLRKTTLPNLFEAQVARSPQAPALVLGDVALTYAEFNLQANRFTISSVKGWSGDAGSHRRSL